MTEVRDWFSAIEQAVAELTRTPDYMVASPSGRFTPAALAARGFPATLPLWSGTGAAVALLPLPSLPAARWPAFIERRGQGLLLATNSATALPRFWMLRVLRDDQACDRLAKQWGRDHRAAVELHKLLGGDPEALEAAAASIVNLDRRKEFVTELGPADTIQKAYSRLVRRVDPSPSFTAYADWFDRIVECGQPDRPPGRDLGVWRRQAVYWAVKTGTRSTSSLLPRTDLVQAIEAFAGIGSGVPTRAYWDAQPGAASGEATQSSLASSAGQDSTDDDVARGLIAALEDQGMDYDGYAHAEAVVALDERGKPERAWGALHSAAWWGARSRGEAPPAMLDGARLLASRHGWDDLAFAIERAEGRGS